MGRELVIREISPSVWQMITSVAPSMHLSRMYGVASAEQAAAVMLKGYEIGLSISASFEFIQIVQGKPTLTPRGALALVRASGLLAGERITETEDACTVWMKRHGNPPVEYEITWAEADSIRAGLVKPGSAHVTYPKNMRKWRAVGFCIDWLFSDVCGGMKRADELGAVVTTEGEVVDGVWSEPAPVPSPALSPSAAVDLDDLIAQHGAEAVMEANDGRVPATTEEVAAIAEKLKAPWQ